MEDKKTKHNKTVLPSAESFSSPEAAGYLFKLIHEGWLRKRWRKRYCVLSCGMLYFYEFKNSDGTEKTCSSLNLKQFGECIKAPRKECKKSPNTFILEPPKKKNDTNESAKGGKQILREYLYTETPEEREKWMAKLQEALSLTTIGGEAKLTHITKTRARPPRGGNGNRRPPTKQHIKERAMMSEVTLEVEPPEIQQNGGSKKRGQIPVSALKPPPPGGKPKPLKPALKKKPEKKENDEPEPALEEKDEEDDDTSLDLSPPPVLTPKSPTPPPAVLKPPSTKKPAVVRSESTGSDNSTEPPPKSPLPPPAALKPPSTKRVVAVRTDSTGSADSSGSLPLQSPLPALVKAELENRSLPSSRTSSIGKSDKGSLKNSKESSRASSPIPDQPEEDVPSAEPVGDEAPVSGPPSDEEAKSANPILMKIGEDKFDFDFRNGKFESEDRIMKARSMMELDWDGDDLPSPPPPPPDLNGDAEPNGDVQKTKNKKKKEKEKGKKKKKDKQVRPSSLVLDI